MTLSTRVAIKVGPYFDILEAALAEGNAELAIDLVSKISPYYHFFDDEHADYFHGAQYALEEDMLDAYKEEYAEPSEMDECFSYDPDC